ncbi:MAG: hypothetical protein MJZ20_01670 [Bacteroidaceae bacterium]|nr:hypothetical protein [Bacteroidaceae bacterium]
MAIVLDILMHAAAFAVGIAAIFCIGSLVTMVLQEIVRFIIKKIEFREVKKKLSEDKDDDNRQ